MAIFIQHESDPALAGVTVQHASSLERLTGADILISPLSVAPKSARIIQRHLEAGALLIQRKSVHDIADPGSRLYSQISRMQEYSCSPMQLLIIFTGLLLPNRKANLRVGTFDGVNIAWRHTKYNYVAFRARLESISDSARLIQLSHDSELAPWLITKERQVIRNHESDGVKVLHPFYRRIVEGTEWWRFLSAFRTFGPARAEVAGKFLERCGTPTIADALEFFSQERNMADSRRPTGIGPTSFVAIRGQLGLHPGEAVYKLRVDDFDKFTQYHESEEQHDQ